MIDKFHLDTYLKLFQVTFILITNIAKSIKLHKRVSLPMLLSGRNSSQKSDNVLLQQTFLLMKM